MKKSKVKKPSAHETSKTIFEKASEETIRSHDATLRRLREIQLARQMEPGSMRVLGHPAKEPSLAESFRESFENPTFILSSIVVCVCAFRLLFDGVTFGLFGLTLTLDHTDPLAYGSILTPVLAGHAYIRAKAQVTQTSKPKVDDPDA